MAGKPGDPREGGWLWGPGIMRRAWCRSGTSETIRDGIVDAASLMPNWWPLNPSRHPAADHRNPALSITETPQVTAGLAGWREPTWRSGVHLLAEQFVNGDGLLADGTATPEPEPAHGGSAPLAPLVPDGTGSATVTGVDGDWLAESPLGRDDGNWRGFPAASVDGYPTRLAAARLSTDRRERVLASRADHGRAIASVEVRHDPATARLVASARARWLRIR